MIQAERAVSVIDTDLLDSEGRLARLAAAAAACTACTRMAERSAVLSNLNGPVCAPVVFVAEAPGRLGGDRTRVPLSGDQAGRNFSKLLQMAGLCREDVFVTNAVLCNPRSIAGTNATPTASEIRRCSTFLAETLRIIDPEVVVALGTVSLRALNLIAPHDVVLREDVATPVRWKGSWLVPLYHPGARAHIHRPFDVQIEDYRRLTGFLASLAPAGSRPPEPTTRNAAGLEPEERPGAFAAISSQTLRTKCTDTIGTASARSGSVRGGRSTANGAEQNDGMSRR